MTSKNPFDDLQDYGHQNQFIAADKKKEKEKKGKPREGEKNLQPNSNLQQKQKQSIHHKSHHKPQKGVPQQPHPKDKHSGTGRGNQLKKGGGGRGNWGNQKDQLNEDKYQQALEIENKEEELEKKEDIVQTQKEEHKLSLDEYYKKKTGSTYQQVNQQHEKNKVTTEQFHNQVSQQWIKKQKLTIMKNKEDIEEEKHQQKKQRKKEKVTKPNIQLGFKTPMEEIENRENTAGSDKDLAQKQYVTNQ